MVPRYRQTSVGRRASSQERPRSGTGPRMPAVSRIAMVVFTVVLAGCGASGLQQIAEAGATERFDGGVVIVATGRDGDRAVGVAGTDATGAPMSPDVTWRIGSVTKMFTAATVMQLVDEGLLVLDAPVLDYVDHEYVSGDVTVRDLLQHTSGVPDYLVVVNDVLRRCPENIDPWELIENDPVFAPGTDWEYSNTNYLILGELMEAVTGKAPAAAIRERIIDPLGLDATYLEGSEPGPPPVPAVADFFDTGPGPITCNTPMWPDATDGAMISSVDDLDRFMRALFDGNLVSADSLAEMIAVNEYGYGLGFRVSSRHRWPVLRSMATAEVLSGTKPRSSTNRQQGRPSS